MRRIFLDDELEKCISEEGYAVIRNFVPETVATGLSSFFDQIDSGDQRAFTISNWSGDTEYRRKTYSKIVAELSVFANNYLQNYKPVMGVFASKRPGQKSEMLLHQDWSLVDETRYRSVSIWLALCDVSHHNGNLQIAPGSHLYAGFPRGMNISVPFEDIRSELKDGFLRDIPLKKGDAIIFDHRLVHGSPENCSDRLRLTAILSLIPDESELIHYYKDEAKDEELEILKLDENDFALIDFFDMPNKPKHLFSLGKVPYSFRRLGINDLLNINR